MSARAPKAELLRQLILDVLQLDGALTRSAETMATEEGQSLARYKVLTAAGCDVRTVPQIARRMGLTRQGVQRVANLLVEDGLARFNPNPEHRGSPILSLTAQGAAAEAAISRKHATWRQAVARELRGVDLTAGLEAVRELLRVVEMDARSEARR